MANQSVRPPFPVFTDSDGTPLEDGFVYVGTENLPPQANPVSIYFDKALTVPAPNPFRTKDGYPSNGGNPSDIYCAATHSVLVKNKNGVAVHSSLSTTLLVASDQVNFDPNVTGSVSRSLNSRLTDTYSVKDFGAKGDGVNDDTSEIQAAVTYVCSVGGTLVFPAGTYLVSGFVTGTLVYNVTLLGHAGSVIKINNTNSLSWIIGGGTTLTLTLQGMTFDADNDTSYPFLTAVQGTSKFRDCTFKNAYSTVAGSSGLYISGAADFDHVIIDNCRFENIGRAAGSTGPTAAVLVNTGTAGRPQKVTIINCHVSGVTNNEVADGANNVIANGFHLIGDGTNTAFATVRGCSFESVKGACVLAQEFERVSIDNCQVYRNTPGTRNSSGDSVGAEFDLMVEKYHLTNVNLFVDEVIAGELVHVRPTYVVSSQWAVDPGSVSYFINGVHLTDATGTEWEGVLYAKTAVSAAGKINVVIRNVNIATGINQIIAWPSSEAGAFTNVILDGISAGQIAYSVAAVLSGDTPGLNENRLVLRDVHSYHATKVPSTRLMSSDPKPWDYAQIEVRMSNTTGILTERDSGGTIINATDSSAFVLRGFPDWGLRARNVTDGAIGAGAPDDAPTDHGAKCYTSEIANNAYAYFPLRELAAGGGVFIFANDVTNIGAALISYIVGIGTAAITTPGADLSVALLVNPATAGDLNVWYDAALGKVGVQNLLGVTAKVTIFYVG